MPTPLPSSRIAIAGASGYVGRLLANQLAGAGHQVLALARHPDTLPTGERISAVAVDVADPEATAHALAGADAAYYLVHAMAGGTGFEARDRELAAAFGRAAKAAGVGRIIYLGALGRGDLSAHLVSRQEVGAVLAASGVPVVELRAAVILGAGSISYEMLRSLTERLPVMVCPRWITTRLQPLAECDLLDYLAGSLVAPSGVYEIGTPDVTDYGTMMRVLRRGEGAAAPAHLHRALRHPLAVGPLGRPGQPGRPAHQPRPHREPGERGGRPRPGAHLSPPSASAPCRSEKPSAGPSATRLTEFRPGCSTGSRVPRHRRLRHALCCAAGPRPHRGGARRPGPGGRGPVLVRRGLGLGAPPGAGPALRREARDPATRPAHPRGDGRLVGGGAGRSRPTWCWPRSAGSAETAGSAWQVDRCTASRGTGGRLPAQGPARPGLLVGAVARAPGGVPGHGAGPGPPGPPASTLRR